MPFQKLSSPDLAAQHVQKPAALLVDERVEHLAHVRDVLVNHGRVRSSILGTQHPRAIAAHAIDKILAAAPLLEVQIRKVSSKPFGQPNVVPVLFGDAVAEPVVCRFMDHRATVVAQHATFAVEDGGRVFGCAADAGRLHVRQFFVRVRPHVSREELDRRAARVVEVFVAALAILGIDPGLQRNLPALAAVGRAVVSDREAADAKRIQPHRYWHRLLPVRLAQVVGQVRFLDE
jgi:hypothetical protein